MPTEPTLANWYLHVQRWMKKNSGFSIMMTVQTNLHAKWRQGLLSVVMNLRQGGSFVAHKAPFNQPTDYDAVLQWEAETGRDITPV